MKIKRIIVAIVVILIVSVVLVHYALYQLLVSPVSFVVHNADSIPAKVARRLDAEMWSFPAEASSVYAYSRGDAFLRFNVPDEQEYEKFKKDFLSLADFSRGKHPKISKWEMEEIASWWGLDSEGDVYMFRYWSFGFDDENRLVYVMRQLD